jgi:hypothetical protein
MWYPAEISLSSYLPLELEEGMLFINRISVGVMEPYIELWELEEIPEDIDSFMSKHGAPVNVIIITPHDGNVRAVQHQIGWWDDGDDTDEYREVTLDDINFLLREYDGYVDIEFDDDDEDIVIIEDKVVLSLASEDDLEDWDGTLMDGLEEEEEF